MNRVVVIFLFLISAFASKAQNDALLSHYMFNQPLYNPAAVGSEQMANVTFVHRSQWLGYSSSFDGSGGAPSTQHLLATIPVQKYLSGIGLSVLNDNLGPTNNLAIQVPLAIKYGISGGTLQFGLMPGVYNLTQKFDELRFNDPSDPFNIGRRESQLEFNLGAGLYFTSRKSFFIGLSAMNLLEPGFDFGLSQLEYAFNTSYNLLAGWSMDITRDIKASPSVLARYDLTSFTFDASLMIDYKSLAWGGLTVRRDEAIVFMIGYSLLNNKELKVGYGLDYILNEQESKQPTSHEVLIKYNLPNFIFGGRKQVKTPRFAY